MSTVMVSRKARGYASASATWHYSSEKLPDEVTNEAGGDYLAVSRRFFKRIKSGQEVVLEPIAGQFKVAPATVQPMYAPEFAGFSRGATLSIAPDGKD